MMQTLTFTMWLTNYPKLTLPSCGFADAETEAHLDHNESAFITSTDTNQASLLTLQYLRVAIFG